MGGKSTLYSTGLIKQFTVCVGGHFAVVAVPNMKGDSIQHACISFSHSKQALTYVLSHD